MMFHSSPLRFSEHQRPFWLLVALAIMLLVSVSVTVAEAASPARLAGNLQRDLGALRAQLEQIDPWASESGRRTVAFNADLGDGSPAFHRTNMVTIVRAAGRHLEPLITPYRDARDHERARAAETLRLGMHQLTERIGRLGTFANPAATVALLGEADAALSRLEHGVAQLVDAPAAADPEPAPAP